MEDRLMVFQQQAADLRDMAKRARRLASAVNEPDADRLRRYAVLLETRAAEIETQTAPQARPLCVMH